MTPTRRSLTSLVVTIAGMLAIISLPASSAVAVADLRPPDSIASDCSIDVSAPLGSWLQAQPSGAHITFRPASCYRVEREIKLTGKSNWKLNGMGSLLRRWDYTPVELRYPKANGFLRLVDFTDSTVEGFSIQGTNTVRDSADGPTNMGSYRQEVEFDHGLSLHGAQRVTVKNMIINSVWGDGVKITGMDQYSKRRSADVTISNVTVTQNGRQGMSINQTSGVLVDGVTITYSRRGGIDLEPNGIKELISNIEVRNSSISSRLLPFPSGGSGPVNDINIHNNTIDRGGVPVVAVHSSAGVARYNWRLQDNVVLATLGSPRAALEFFNVHGVVVSGNVLSLAASRKMTAVGLSGGSDNVEISCNQFVGAANNYLLSTAAVAPLTQDNSRLAGPRPCASGPAGRPTNTPAFVQ